MSVPGETPQSFTEEVSAGTEPQPLRAGRHQGGHKLPDDMSQEYPHLYPSPDSVRLQYACELEDMLGAPALGETVETDFHE